MTAGETVLKFTDYPFAYSAVILVGSIFGFGLSPNKYLFLGVAGAFGTFLTVVDPIGWCVKKRLEQRIKPNDDKKHSKLCSWICSKLKTESDKIEPNSNVIEPTIENKKSAIHSRGIGIEVDKIIGLLYFLVTVILFLAVMLVPSSTLADSLTIHDKTEKNLLVDSHHIRIYSVIGSSVILLILGIIGFRRWLELDEKVETEGIHQLAIGNEFATENSVEKMTGAIDLGDWITAKEWAKKIKKEIEKKKGKRDLIITTSEAVYEPLYKDLIALEGSSQQIESNKRYATVTFEAWGKIKVGLLHLSVTDSEFMKLADSLQREINRYNNSITSLTKDDVRKVIINHLSSTYENVQDVTYNVVGIGKNWNADIQLDALVESAIFSSPPNSSYPDSSPKGMKITLKDNSGNSGTKILTSGELEKFIEDWDSILADVEELEHVKRLRISYGKILEYLPVLKDMCEKQNKLKYEVF